MLLPEQEAFINTFSDIFLAVDRCFQANLFVPGMILIYSAIDSLAWLSAPATCQRVTRHEFCRWVDEFLIPTGFVTCSSLDLYAARCGLLHNASPESDLSRGKKARELWYAWGNAELMTLEETIRRRKKHACALHVDDLFNSLKKGFHDYVYYLFHSASRDEWHAVLDRSRKLFSNVPKR